MTEVSPSTLAVEAVTLTLNEKIDFSNELEEVSSTSVPFLEPHPSGVDASQGNEKTVDSPISILIVSSPLGKHCETIANSKVENRSEVAMVASEVFLVF